MVKVVEAKVVEVMAKGVTKGAVVVNKAVVIEDVGFVSALIVTVRIRQLNFVGSCMENPQLNIQSSLYTRESTITSCLCSLLHWVWFYCYFGIGFGSTATLAHHGTSIACLATQDPWVIDSSATDHMTGTSGLLSNLEHSSSLPNVTLADGLATIVSGLGTANLSPNFLSLLSYIFLIFFLIYCPLVSLLNI